MVWYGSGKARKSPHSSFLAKVMLLCTLLRALKKNVQRTYVIESNKYVIYTAPKDNRRICTAAKRKF